MIGVDTANPGEVGESDVLWQPLGNQDVDLDSHLRSMAAEA